MEITKRPLLVGVMAFVIGELIGVNSYMTKGLGMVVLLILVYLIWYIRKEKSTMPFFVFAISICFFLGIGNGYRCRLPDALKEYLSAVEEESVVCTLQGRVERIEYKSGKRILIIKSNRMTNQQFISKKNYRVKVYETYQSGIGDTKESAVISDIHIGNIIECQLELWQPKIPSNPGEFDSQAYYRARGIDFLGKAGYITVTDKRQHLVLQKLTEMQNRAQQILIQNLSEEHAGILGTMLLGNSGEMEPQLRKLYQRNGIAHILAISALHISILGNGCYQLLRRLRFPPWLSGGIVLAILVLYGWVTGYSSSTVRAVIMFGLMLAGDWLERTYDMLTGIGIAAWLLLVENPWKLWDAGFLLSFSAVLALGLVVPLLQTYIEPFRKGKVRWYLANSILSGIVLQLITGPVVIYFFYDFPVYGIFLNLLVIPLMTPLVFCGFAGILLSMVSPWLGRLVLLPCDWILKGFDALCTYVEQLPGSVWHVGAIRLWEIGIYYGILVCCYLMLQKKYYIRLGVIMVCYCCFLILTPTQCLLITMLDIGQGDCILMKTPNQHYILVDGGSSTRSGIGEYVITPAVKYYGSGRLDYVFISHMDQDHVNGIEELIVLSEQGGIQIGCLVVPELALWDKEFQILIKQAEEAGIQVKTMESGDQLVLETVKITCLYPKSSEEEKDMKIGNYSENNTSMVLSVSYRSFQMLFTGDLEIEGEQQLLEQSSQWMPQQYDVLKVGHHGSKGSTGEALLAQIHPEYAVISCGKENRYGHPHEAVMERLENNGCKTLVTCETGAVTFEISRNGISVETYFEK